MSPAPTLRRYGTVLLTGATGFLGGHLLARLLVHGADHVICHVRADNAQAGLRRVEANLQHLQCWQPGWAGRLSVVLGDLSQPQLGMGAAFRDLPPRLDAIFHNGAHVNYILNYAQLKPTNVGSTQEVIRLAQAADAPLFYISTLRLFDHRMDATPIREDDPVNLQATMANGYAYSKAMAERLVTAAAGQGLKAAIFRPGLLCGDGEAGVPNASDAISLLMRGCVTLGAAPESALQVNLTSVAHATEGMVALARDPASLGGRWHLVHDQPTPINRLMQALKRHGYPLELMPYRPWVEALKSRRSTASNDLDPLLGYFTPGFPEESTRRVFDSGRTRALLQAHGIVHPDLDDAFLRRNIDGMVRTGFLAPPRAAELATA